jgi:hypothetical protein
VSGIAPSSWWPQPSRVSGIFGSISKPHWLSTIASYLPAQPLTQAIAAALGHTAGGHPLLPARDLIVLAAWTVAGLAVAGVTFRWEPHRPAQRRPPAPRTLRTRIQPPGGEQMIYLIRRLMRWLRGRKRQ